ncbi:hypothetical protein [Asticcacaulis solisilvae]|uniref:hypothetical protein n=1 Tax=Asticcacaulis solisilvae TaxID=1217274 RepID=UPI003FD7A7F4
MRFMLEVPDERPEDVTHLTMLENAAARSDSRPDDISVLIRRRAEIRDEISRSRKALRRLATEFQDVDAAIRTMKEAGPAVRGPASAPGGTSNVTRILFEALTAAETPMTSEALARRVMGELGLDAKNKAVTRYVVRRVCICLWEQVQKGHFRKAEPLSRPMRWERVRPRQ